jgi:Na+-translocating ferredoxin:NAD+ oxidoreductase RnfC subunit
MARPEIEKIKNAGVIGAGGAGFPSHVKFDARVDTLIINAAECEPMIHADKQILVNYFGRVYDGMKAAASLTGAGRVVLALKAKYKDAILAIEDFKAKKAPGLAAGISSGVSGGSAAGVSDTGSHASGKTLGTSEIDGSFDFEVFKLGNFYPAGDEQVLVYEVTKRIVPEGGIPLMVGVVVTNVETLLNVSNALNDRSVISKFVTINGEVANPMTIEVPVGTPVKSLIDYCGGIKIKEWQVLDGGPMMGKLIDENTYAVRKTTKSILVLPTDSIVIEHKVRSTAVAVKRAQATCLSCRMCTDLCPRYLLGHELFPDDMMKKLYRGRIDESNIQMFDFAYLCCDCGLCELYSCVVDLSARSLFNYIKAELAKSGIKNPHNRKELKVNEFRDYRKVPVDRLEKRLEIDKYHDITPLSEFKMVVPQVKLYLSQHLGAPAVPIVKPGDAVASGAVVAEIPEGKLGARVHSSISGTVSEVTDSYIMVNK